MTNNNAIILDGLTNKMRDKLVKQFIKSKLNFVCTSSEQLKKTYDKNA